MSITSKIGSTSITNYGQSITGAIDNILTYSTAEKIVGKWIDGRPLYGRLINCGTLPSEAKENYTMASITNVDHAHIRFAYGYNSSNGLTMTFPYVVSSNTSANVAVHIFIQANTTTAGITVNTGSDRTLFGKLYVYAEYTKTT